MIFAKREVDFPVASFVSFWCTVMVNILWEREDVSFMLVAPTVRCFIPCIWSFSNLSWDCATISWSPLICTPMTWRGVGERGRKRDGQSVRVAVGGVGACAVAW